MDFDTVEKAINDTRADIEKYLKKDEFKMMAALKAYSLKEAVSAMNGQAIFKSEGNNGLQVEMKCNGALIKIIMMDMLERFGIEEIIKLEVARRITNATIQKVEKRFDTPEEMEVFKKMHNMSAEDIEKLKIEK